MAERRMISRKVILTDNYYKLTDKAKLLYFYLILEADDDGFVGNIRNAICAAGANIRTLVQLAEYNYVIYFPSGVIAITHWKMQNRIEKRMCTPTIYTREYEQLSVDGNGVYNYRTL